MSKFTRGKDGRLYYGKGSKGGLAPQLPHPSNLVAPRLPVKIVEPVVTQSASYQDTRLNQSLSLENIRKIKVPEFATEVADDIAMDAEQIEFPNHNDSYQEDWLTLSELIESNSFYQNNCDAVSSELAQHINMMIIDYDDLAKVDVASLQFERGMHAAVRVQSKTGDTWVLDYTARQFDRELPVPLVLSESDWKTLITHHVKTQHGDTLWDGK